MATYTEKFVVEICEGMVSLMPFNEVAFEAASDGFEYYNDYFAPDTDENWDYVDTVTVDPISGDTFKLRFLVVQNPLEPYIPLAALEPLWKFASIELINDNRGKWVDDIPF